MRLDRRIVGQRVEIDRPQQDLAQVADDACIPAAARLGRDLATGGLFLHRALHMGTASGWPPPIHA